MKGRKAGIAAVWVGIVVAYVLFTRSRGFSALEAAEELRSIMADNWWGPVVFVCAYVSRPLVLFPATVLTVLGGLAFGLVGGSFWTVMAANLSTAIVYVVGRYFGSGDSARRLTGLLGGMLERATQFPFETTLVMRLLYLPFDAVSYVGGFLRLRFVPFAFGSLLGTLPGTLAFVGFGASIDSLDQGTPTFDLRVLLAAVTLAVAGAVLSRWLRGRQNNAVSLTADLTPLPTSEKML